MTCWKERCLHARHKTTVVVIWTRSKKKGLQRYREAAFQRLCSIRSIITVIKVAETVEGPGQRLHATVDQFQLIQHQVMGFIAMTLLQLPSGTVRIDLEFLEGAHELE